MAEHRETVYIKADRNIEVTKRTVSLGDVLQIECVDSAVKAKINSIRLLEFEKKNQKKQDRMAVSILRVIEKIHEVYPYVEVQNLGESDFIVTFEEQKTAGRMVHIIKTISVVLISFFGAAFSIMAFNNDVDITNIFSQIYEQFTGQSSDGFTIIELTYSIGLIIGILVFFNHFGKKRFTVDPTPIEVEMRLYENDIQTTLIDNYSRKGQELDVDTKCDSGSNRT